MTTGPPEAGWLLGAGSHPARRTKGHNQRAIDVLWLSLTAAALCGLLSQTWPARAIERGRMPA
jgi:hypothetical protein